MVICWTLANNGRKMTGYHIVKVFKKGANDLELPEGWKPFAVYGTGAPLYVVCRKWVRVEKEKQ